MREFIPCENDGCENGYVTKTVNGQDVVTECGCRIQWIIESKFEILFNKSNVPESALDYSIDTYIGDDKENNIRKLKKYVSSFNTTFNDKIIYMYGERGNQKTTIACWVACELMRQGKSVYYALMNNLLNDLQDAKFKEEINLDKYYKSDLLIIDRAFEADQMTVYKSGYQLPFLDSFLREAIDIKNRPIIFVSNIHYSEIAKNKFNADIEDLIKRKVEPYNLCLTFNDNYALKDNFVDLWE